MTHKNDIVFNAINWWSNDYEYDDEDEDNKSKFLIKVFGRTEDGKSVSANIVDFTPYFYIKIDNSLNEQKLLNIEKWFDKLLPTVMKKSLIDLKVLEKKDFYGFKNDKMFYFLRFKFKNIMTYKYSIKNIFAKDILIPGINITKNKFTLYESNMEPILRMMHIKNVRPSGWIKLPAKFYDINDNLLTTKCNIDLTIHWVKIESIDKEKIAPISIASFDIECTSSHGDFPVPAKSYSKVSNELYAYFNANLNEMNLKEKLYDELLLIFDHDKPGKLSKVYTRNKFDGNILKTELTKSLDDIFNSVRGKIVYNDETVTQNKIIQKIVGILGQYYSLENKKIWEDDVRRWSGVLPELEGDSIIQIGITTHLYGDKNCYKKEILTRGTCSDIPGVEVIRCKSESDLLLKFRDRINFIDPDIITGYNILGFDFMYLYERSLQLGIEKEFLKIGRFNDTTSRYIKKNLSSSALGENLLKFIDMEGRTIIDLMKVIQRDHKLDSYKLDNVAHHFINLKKNDVSPNEIFSLFKGNQNDRKKLAEYCVQDCALCNQLIIKLEIIANNIGMSNVCSVPLSYIFLRGQGIKIFSLVAKQCRTDDFLIPCITKSFVIKDIDNNNDDDDPDKDTGFEGATVLEPETGIYIKDPVNVLDYASLYPSSMISENLSHDCHVLNEDDENYGNIEGINYIEISYDIYTGTGDKKTKIGVETRKFAQKREGVLPRILKKLLGARKITRKKINFKTILLNNNSTYTGLLNKFNDYIEINDILNNKVFKFNNYEVSSINDTYDTFQKAILDGLQLAYKVTANSLYGQTGSKLSPVYMKEVAACTTATGRNLIMKAKNFMESKYNARTIYGDTDSIFIIFPNKENNVKLEGQKAIMHSIKTSQDASNEFKKLLKKPHDLEYEKSYWPFILVGKKKYCANKYDFDDKKCTLSSMGIVLKRRDNAPIVKYIYGGILDIILNKLDIKASLKFLRSSLNDMIKGKFPLEDFIVTKSLKNSYANPSQIAHFVLSERMGQRDPGNKPQANDRLPYIYIETPAARRGEKKLLQGDKIEHPDYIREHKLKIDYRHYLENQVMNPVAQIYGIILEELEGYRLGKQYFVDMKKTLMKEKNGNLEKVRKRLAELREKEVKRILFEPILIKIDNKRNNVKEITSYFDKLLM